MGKNNKQGHGDDLDDPMAVPSSESPPANSPLQPSGHHRSFVNNSHSQIESTKPENKKQVQHRSHFRDHSRWILGFANWAG